jgi:hypothetical protein
MYNMFAVTQFTEETGAILLLMLAAAVSGFFTTSSGRVRGIAPLSLLSALVLACWLEGGRRASPSAPFSVGFDVVGFLLYELTIARVIWKTAGNIGELCILTVLVLSQVGYIFGIGGGVRSHPRYRRVRRSLERYRPPRAALGRQSFVRTIRH